MLCLSSARQFLRSAARVCVERSTLVRSSVSIGCSTRVRRGLGVVTVLVCVLEYECVTRGRAGVCVTATDIRVGSRHLWSFDAPDSRSALVCVYVCVCVCVRVWYVNMQLGQLTFSKDDELALAFVVCEPRAVNKVG
jgi:hypothetical protein